MIAIIGGTGICDSPVFKGKSKKITTSYGKIEVTVGRLGGKKIVFLARHGIGHATPPHKVNYRANIMGLKSLGIERILAINSVGCINDRLHPGDLLVPYDLIDFTRGRESTFYDDEVIHIDLSEPYCPELRTALLQAADEVKGKVFDGGVYACTQGPRFETPAEIRMLSTVGADVVGMTGLPEVTLAREQELCLASICTVTNYAAGKAKKKLTAIEVKELIARGMQDIRKIIVRAVELIPSERKCACGDALIGARI
jgi:5'-methylthioadenosine phosphorylase